MKIAMFAIVLACLSSCEFPTASAPASMTAASGKQIDCAVDYDNWGHVVPHPALTKACRDRMAAGWRLVGFSGGAFVWVR